MASAQFCLLALAALCCTLVQANIPPGMKTCGRRDKQLNTCVKNNVLKLKPELPAGIPEFDIPSLEPVYLNEVALAKLDNFNAVANNLSLEGLSNFEINFLNIDLAKNRIDAELTFAKVAMKSGFDVKTKILVPIQEKGPIDFIAENVGAKAVLKFKTMERRGRNLIYFPTMTCKLLIKDYSATFRSDANPGSPIVQAINEILVKNRKEITESMIPNLEKAISIKVLEIANRVCKRFTYDQLLPDHD